MSGLYAIAGISKQAHYQALSRGSTRLEQEAIWLAAAHRLRRDHPRMGMRALYDHIGPEGIGRDKFIELLAANGFRLKRIRSFSRTTFAHPTRRYPNLISGKELDGPNQLWVSDITYIRVRERFSYLTMILDVYSRRILGWSLSSNLGAESNLRALKMAIRARRGKDLRGLIHHSDRGSQYIYGPYTKLLDKNEIDISMGNKAWENAHAERINGTIKNAYVLPYGPRNSQELERATRKAIVLYNRERQHSALGKLSPVEFEKSIANMTPEQRPKCKINY